MGKRIVIMAGGTGGHVFPALAVAQELQSRGWQVSWLGTANGLESRVIPENGIEIDWLVVEGIRGKGVLTRIMAVFMLLQACGQALSVLRRREPNIVLGMGGFVAAPGGLMSWLLGIPLVIHEQNRIPGTTNRLLRRLARKVLEAFPGSFRSVSNIQFTGNPLRKEFLNLVERARWNKDSAQAIRILVVGGSQGAQILNQVAPLALSRLGMVEVKHQSGLIMAEEVAENYHSLKINAETMAFIEDMAAAYQWADLAICRAGAMTVSELAATGLPAVLIPLAHAIDDHQTANACYLRDAGAAILLPQHELTTETLVNALHTIMADLPAMSQAAKRQARLDATQVVADFCIAEAA